MLMRFATLYHRAKLQVAFISPKVRREIGWVVAPFGLVQFFRLASSIILARLLAPEIFGIMLLINSLRTGVELLSDIGIGQSIVRSPNGDDKRFLDVAWTIQALRGFLLFIVALILALPVAEIYGDEQIAILIIAVSPIFIFTGLQSPGLFVAQRKMKLSRWAYYDIICVIISSIVTIALAFIIPSVWALIAGLLISSFIQLIMTYVIFDSRIPTLTWDSKYVAEIVKFGKWIFLSTAVYFAASSFDRFYFVAALPIAIAGVYGLARTFSDMVGALAQRAGAFLVFPRIAAQRGVSVEVGPFLRSNRRKALALLAVITGAAVAGSDQFILLAYDDRYHAAAFMVPLLLVSVWFGIMSTFADSTLMGCGRPAPGAFANGAKFLTLLIGLPLAIGQGEILLALSVLVLAEIVRWLALAPSSYREGFSHPFDDIQLTIIMMVTALTTKALGGVLGLVPSIEEWWAYHLLLHA